jgi:hypothetical protein
VGLDVDQLDLIIDFLRRERALLAKHTARVYKMLADPRRRRAPVAPHAMAAEVAETALRPWRTNESSC